MQTLPRQQKLLPCQLDQMIMAHMIWLLASYALSQWTLAEEWTALVHVSWHAQSAVVHRYRLNNAWWLWLQPSGTALMLEGRAPAKWSSFSPAAMELSFTTGC